MFPHSVFESVPTQREVLQHFAPCTFVAHVDRGQPADRDGPIVCLAHLGHEVQWFRNEHDAWTRHVPAEGERPTDILLFAGPDGPDFAAWYVVA